MSEFAIFGVGRVDDFFEDNLQGDAFELRQHPASANPEPQLLHCPTRKNSESWDGCFWRLPLLVFLSSASQPS